MSDEPDDTRRVVDMTFRGGQPELRLRLPQPVSTNKNYTYTATFGDPYKWFPYSTTVDTLLEKHQTFTKIWKESAAYHDLRTFFTDTVLKIECFRITACMCLGLGSLSAVYGTKDPGDCRSAMYQLVAFESMIELLKQKYRYDIDHIYFQEPDFGPVDREFLKLKGYTILQTPESENRMSEKIFLFMPGGEEEVVISSLNVAYPPLYIGGNLRKLRAFRPTRPGPLGRMTGKSPELVRPLVESFLNKRLRRSMLKFDPQDWTSYHYIYYRPASDDELRPGEDDPEPPPPSWESFIDTLPGRS